MNNYQHGTLYGIKIKTNIDLPVAFPFEIQSGCGSKEKTIIYNKDSIIDAEHYNVYSHNERGYIFYGYNKGEKTYMIQTEKTGTVIVNQDSILFSSSTFVMKHAYLLSFGMGLAMLLRLNGFVVIHATSIRLNEKTLMVMGPSGVGKSTLCSYLIKNYGAELVSDDMTCINLNTKLLYTGFPVVRLWPPTVNIVFNKDASNYSTVGGKGKVYLPISNHSKTIANHIDRVIMLQSDKEVLSINEMKKEYLIYNIIKHIYNRVSLDSNMLCTEMNSIVNILVSNDTKGYLVNSPRTYNSLSILCDELVYRILQ